MQKDRAFNIFHLCSYILHNCIQTLKNDKKEHTNIIFLEMIRPFNVQPLLNALRWRGSWLYYKPLHKNGWGGGMSYALK